MGRVRLDHFWITNDVVPSGQNPGNAGRLESLHVLRHRQWRPAGPDHGREMLGPHLRPDHHRNGSDRQRPEERSHELGSIGRHNQHPLLWLDTVLGEPPRVTRSETELPSGMSTSCHRGGAGLGLHCLPAGARTGRRRRC